MSPDIIIIIFLIDLVLTMMIKYMKKKIHSVFIGDSFLHGACVNNKDNLISNLRSTKIFKEKNILNLVIVVMDHC